MAKSRKSFSLQLKRPTFCNFWGLKAVWRKNYDYKPQLFLEILNAVCLSVDWVPKYIQNFFSNHGTKISSTLWDWDRCGCLQCLICVCLFACQSPNHNSYSTLTRKYSPLLAFAVGFNLWPKPSLPFVHTKIFSCCFCLS